MKTITLVLLWLVGSATAIGVAWSGVGVLDDELVAPAPAVISTDGEVGLVSESVDLLDDRASRPSATDESAPAIGEGDQRTTSSSTVTARPSATSTSTSASTSRSTSTTRTTARSASTAATSTTASTSPTTASSSTTNTTFAGSGSSTTQPGTSVGQPAQSQTKTFTLIGGTTSIRFSPSETKVLWATPNPGYEVRIEPESPGIKVEFRSDDHRSRIDAWWNGGPRHEIREDD